MLVTLLGMVTDNKLKQPENARCPMFVTLLGIIVFLQPAINVLSFVLIMALHPSRESYTELPLSTTMVAICGQLENAKSPMLVTLLGIVTEVKPVHPENAAPPMLVTLLGILTEVKPLQLANACTPMLVTLLRMVTEVKPLQL